jgi:hypothetical protein
MMAPLTSFVKSNFRSAVLIFFYTSITSCTTLISDEFPEYDKEPVLNSILIAGQPIKAHLSFAEKIDTTNLQTTGDAAVYFRSGETDIQTMMRYDSGLFYSSHLLEPGEIVELNAMLPGYDEISARDSVPLEIPVEITDHTNMARYTDDGSYMAGLTIRFSDNPQTDDFYELVISRRAEERFYNLHVFNDRLDILLNEGIDPYATSTLLFSDALFKDEVVEMSLDFNPGGSSRHCYGIDSCYEVFDAHTLIAELRHVSEAYYLYKKQFYLYEKTREVDFVDGTATALSNYTNVKNGRGIVAAYAFAIDSLQVPRDSVLQTSSFPGF